MLRRHNVKLFAGFVAPMREKHLLERLLLGGLVRGNAYAAGHGKEERMGHQIERCTGIQPQVRRVAEGRCEAAQNAG